MIELYIISNIDQPWKRELIAEYASPEHCQAKAKFTKQEITAGLNGDLIQGKYIIEFAPRFLHNLAIDYILEDCDDLTQGEIGSILGISKKETEKVFLRAIKKLKSQNTLKEVLLKALELKRSIGDKDFKIVTTKIINISGI